METIAALNRNRKVRLIVCDSEGHDDSKKRATFGTGLDGTGRGLFGGVKCFQERSKEGQLGSGCGTGKVLSDGAACEARVGSSSRSVGRFIRSAKLWAVGLIVDLHWGKGHLFLSESFLSTPSTAVPRGPRSAKEKKGRPQPLSLKKPDTRESERGAPRVPPAAGAGGHRGGGAAASGIMANMEEGHDTRDL